MTAIHTFRLTKIDFIFSACKFHNSSSSLICVSGLARSGKSPKGDSKMFVPGLIGISCVTAGAGWPATGAGTCTSRSDVKRGLGSDAFWLSRPFVMY